MDVIPKIKKTITSFLTSEEGKISKQSLLLLGTLMGTAAITSISSKSVYAQCSCGGGGCGTGSAGASGSGSAGGTGGCSGTGGSSGCVGAPGGGPASAGCTGCSGAGAAAGPGGCSGCSTGGCAGCGTGSGGGNGGGGCFTFDQLVLTPEGAKEISKIKIGSKVISYDEKADNFTTSIVGSVIVHDGKISFLNNFHKHPLVKLLIKVNNKVLVTKVTDNHPYLDATNKLYKQLRGFKIDDKITTIEGNGIIVEKSNIIDANSPAEEHNEIVYNLEMKEGPQNYTVNGAIVHNGGK